MDGRLAIPHGRLSSQLNQSTAFSNSQTKLSKRYQKTATTLHTSNTTQLLGALAVPRTLRPATCQGRLLKSASISLELAKLSGAPPENSNTRKSLHTSNKTQLLQALAAASTRSCQKHLLNHFSRFKFPPLISQTLATWHKEGPNPPQRCAGLPFCPSSLLYRQRLQHHRPHGRGQRRQDTARSIVHVGQEGA